MTYLTDKKQNEVIEAIIKKQDFTKVPNEYRSLIISLIENNCIDDKLIKAISKRKIGDCRIFNRSILNDGDKFYDTIRYSSTFSNIFQIAISKRAILSGMKFEKFYLSELTKIQNKRTFDFQVKGYLYILFYYAIKGKDKVYISIYNGLMEKDYKELIEYRNNIRSDYYSSTLVGSDHR